MLKRISLENFRNHKKLELDLGSNTIILGKNGAGKSNILEAIVLLSYCRSYREDRKVNLINLDSEFARVVGDDLEVFLSRSPRFYMKARHKGVFKRLADFVGLVPTVILSPEILSIVTGSPRERRRFLDIAISQVDPHYLDAIVNYERVRKQRNSLLRAIRENKSSEGELSYWNDELVKFAEIITAKRTEAVDLFNKILSPVYGKVSQNERSKLELKYLLSSNDLKSDLIKSLKRDIADERTGCGPHKDDLEFDLNGRNMQGFASRGEIKTAILALKIGELEYIGERSRSKELPILLLDDIFSEFDPERRGQLGEVIAKYQSIITTTEKDHLSKELLERAKIVELK